MSLMPYYVESPDEPAEIAAALGYKRRTNALREVVNGMLEAGVATYLYPEKPNSRKQKIRLVEK